jgi:hypothetical protein
VRELSRYATDPVAFCVWENAMRTKSVVDTRYSFLVCTPETVEQTRKRYAATHGAAADPLVLTVQQDGKLELLSGAR